MLWWLLLVPAFAVWPLDEGVPPTLVRVEDPSHPQAIATSSRAAILAEPPEDGTPWVWEDLAFPDGLSEGWEAEVAPRFDALVASEAIGASAWHRAGFRGQGVRVAVFDIQWSGSEVDPAYLGAAGTADCWAHPSCERPLEPMAVRFSYERGVHGMACAEIVRDVAPGASIYLVRVNGRTTFESAVQWAIRNDIDIVSLSMSFFNSSFYDGTGPFADLVRQLDAAGVLLVTSAGNYAGSHWSAPWRDGDGDGRHDGDGSNGVRIAFGAGRWPVYVQWDEFRSCGLSDLDVIVKSPTGRVVGRGLERQGLDESGCSPSERVTVEAAVEGVYSVEIVARRLTSAFLEVDLLAPGGRVVDPSPRFSMADPGPSPHAFVVGSVRAEGYLRNRPQGFSSWGPSRAGVPKPDVAGPDGLSVRGFATGGFFGTSAATPAVAGAIALVMSRDPSLTPREAAERVRAWAMADGVQVDPRGDDPQWGAGRVRLPDPGAEAGCGRGLVGALLWPVVGLGGWRRFRLAGLSPAWGRHLRGWWDRRALRRRPRGIEERD